MFQMYAVTLLVLMVILVLIIMGQVYREDYFCTHIVGGYVLLFLATISQHICEHHYSTIGKPLRTFFGVIFFCTSYLAFCWVYLWFQEDYTYGILRSTKEFMLLAITVSLFLIIKKFYYLALLLTYAILLGMLMGLCNICFLKKRALIKRLFFIIIRRVRNIFRRARRPRRVYVVFPTNPGIEELDARLHGNNY